MTLLVSAVFTKSSGTPATGEALTDIAMYLYSRNKSTAAVVTVWSGVNPTEEVGGGIYTRSYASDDPTTYDYFAYAVYSGATVLDTNYSLYSGAGGSTSEEVWANTTRTLTQSAASVTSAVSGSTITQYRGTRWSMTITISDSTGYSKLWFTVKRSQEDADTAALVMVEKASGLLYINGAAATTAANASITVNSSTSITVMVKGVETAKLAPSTGLYYDVKALINSDGPDILGEGAFTIDADTTRATS